MAPGGLGEVIQVLAGEIGRVREDGVLDLKNHAGPVPPLRWTPFGILFGRDASTNLDALIPALDGDDFRTGLGNFVAEKHQTFLELREISKKQQEDKNKRRVRHNAAIMWYSSGERARVGDVMLVKEADNKMAQKGTHAKVAHKTLDGAVAGDSY